MKNLLITSLFLFSVFAFSQNYKVKVIGVMDGDTIEVLDQDKKMNFRVRLAEVDCPERKQAFGNKAKQFTSDQVFGKIVTLEITDTDRYGRYIGRIYYDDKYLSAELIKNGLGWHYKQYSKSLELAHFEKIAKEKKLGLWIDKNPVAPWEFRRKK